jgi:hypothetical protein
LEILKNRSGLGDQRQIFASVFTQEDTDSIPDIAQKYHGLDAASITFTVEQIE